MLVTGFFFYFPSCRGLFSQVFGGQIPGRKGLCWQEIFWISFLNQKQQIKIITLAMFRYKTFADIHYSEVFETDE